MQYPMLKNYSLLLLFIVLIASKPLMIEHKEELLSTMKMKNIAVIYYGQNDRQQFQVFQDVIPTTNHLYQGIEFIYIPSNKFKLNRPNPSLSIYRKIGSGDWLLYSGNFQKQEINNWIKQSIFEQLQELRIESLDRILKEHLKSFLIVDYGEFELIRTKIYLQEFCAQQEISCFKIRSNNPLLNVALKLMNIGHQDRGISRLAYYNPTADTFQLYTKDLWFLRRQQLMQLYEGRKGIIASSGANHHQDIQLQEFNDNL